MNIMNVPCHSKQGIFVVNGSKVHHTASDFEFDILVNTKDRPFLEYRELRTFT